MIIFESNTIKHAGFNLGAPKLEKKQKKTFLTILAAYSCEV